MCFDTGHCRHDAPKGRNGSNRDFRGATPRHGCGPRVNIRCALRRPTLLIAGREQCLLALAGRKADQPTERDMAEQHKPGEKVHLQGGERRRRRLRLRSDVCRRRAFSPNAQRQGCALRVGSRRDALAQAQRAWQRRQVGISRQQDGIVTRRTKRLDHETPGAAASHRAGCRHRREGHVL
jgi:hypothetical protein